MPIIEIDVWVRGTQHARTHTTDAISNYPQAWADDDVRRLLSEMLLALEREKNPAGDPPPVTLRGFNWIVSPDEKGGVLLHVELQMGTASAGPFDIDEPRLTELMTRVMSATPGDRVRVH